MNDAIHLEFFYYFKSPLELFSIKKTYFYKQLKFKISILQIQIAIIVVRLIIMHEMCHAICTAVFRTLTNTHHG